ncbi:hypothetical protein NEFER03_0315 [Nematocida sp. LUAm3]|nr:hypothetical protein NEFER03_0315 [Nematocida sp. LUAm3]KAI5173767.1 hypothetical protein NEFER02_0283 [Nematocida sp. LUAm2]KAI5176990.1 hypothetical protein NEFER01_0315 [Nematocida sp. LUAm1]
MGVPKNKTFRRWMFSLFPSIASCSLQKIFKRSGKVRFAICGYFKEEKKEKNIGYIEMVSPVKVTGMEKLLTERASFFHPEKHREEIIKEIETRICSIRDPFVFGARALHRGGRPKKSALLTLPTHTPPSSPAQPSNKPLPINNQKNFNKEKKDAEELDAITFVAYKDTPSSPKNSSILAMPIPQKQKTHQNKPVKPTQSKENKREFMANGASKHSHLPNPPEDILEDDFSYAFNNFLPTLTHPSDLSSDVEPSTSYDEYIQQFLPANYEKE